MEDPVMQSAEADLSGALSRYRLRRHQRYACVHVLLLSWKDSDIKEIADELSELGSIFREQFNYLVWPYHIPSQKPQEELQVHVSQFISRYADEENLIVVFYSGHGGRAANSEDAACIWAADQMTPSGQDSRWPSFTKVLCQELRAMLREYGSATLPGLQRRMLRKEAGATKQPFYFPYSSDDSVGVIRLQPWRPLEGSSASEIPLPPLEHAASLYLRLFLIKQPKPSERESLLRWLTRGSPSIIHDIEVIERTITEATEVGSLSSEILQPKPGLQQSVLPWLSQKAQVEAGKLFSSLREALTLPEDLPHASQTVDLIETISTRTHALLHFLSDNLSSFELASRDTQSVQALSENRVLASRVAMRLTLLREEGMEEPCRVNYEDQATSNQRFRNGKKGSSTVLVDYWYYEEPASEEAFVAIKHRVARISKLLAEDKPDRFRILRGLGYVHEVLHGRRFGFVYELPAQTEICTLADLMRSMKMVPLQVRKRLAAVICDAVLDLHAIGWFHKAIRSDNILIFKNADSAGKGQPDYERYMQYDLVNPYLAGFDCSRPADAETWTATDFSYKNNIYRHPDRWGRPRGFERHHDVYALGVLLLEVGLWKALPSLDKKRREFTHIQQPESFRDLLLGPICASVAHAAGSRYASAVRSCIRPRDWKKYENWEAQSIIREEVLSLLS
ncbi:uncharacterized protein N0V89_003334 [Didymosphaeria variabile]|uniref:Protein kinase domain-containing protein n=1 Tax=Didymosphaeria variabile TaxID=1932322 RepID=A0A9W8XTD0_9PLEO|nr:uncharacterized protein N0V89_003334 [Didymosphaeria variabile]KAJ4358750.1 hypothetical protein N0V89_003334 [Didymosphaeria variabile]